MMFQSTPGKEQIISHSPSLLENSPDRSISYIDPKTFLPHEQSEVSYDIHLF